ncbi:hypothetical protein GRJ2_000246900 [Grus japonensis]|uniref:Uncharacterized protein n=1 Tax=Grus japonensis TaxID=30415 RepID=A0ABC9VY70_GRUJA
MVRQAVPLQPMEVDGGADIHLQPMEDPTPEQVEAPEGGCDPVGSPHWSKLLAGPMALCREEPRLEQEGWDMEERDCSFPQGQQTPPGEEQLPNSRTWQDEEETERVAIQKGTNCFSLNRNQVGMQEHSCKDTAVKDDKIGSSQEQEEEETEPEITTQSLSLSELQDVQESFSRQLGEQLVTWLLQCWDSGASSLELEGREAKQLGSLSRERGIGKAIGKGTQALSLWRRLLSGMRERHPFKEDVICHPGKWTSMERGIQYPRELAMQEMGYYDPDNTQSPTDPVTGGSQQLTVLEAEVSLTGNEWEKPPIDAGPEAPCILGIDRFRRGYFKDPEGYQWAFGISALELEEIEQLSTLPGLSEDPSVVGLLRIEEQQMPIATPVVHPWQYRTN